MPSSHLPAAAALNVRAYGVASAARDEVGPLRKRLPAWAPAGTAGHFLKYADEQTVMAVAAVDRAVEQRGPAVLANKDWMVIAAPRFIGRTGGAATLARFSAGGGPAISPHLIPQHSLHSVSGALSILLASRAPNLGVGGGGESLAEGLLAALTLPGLCGASGAWFVATAWSPEPIVRDDGTCENDPVCHAVALALDAVAAGENYGRLESASPLASGPAAADESSGPSVADLVARLGSGPADFACHARWSLAGAGTLALHIPPAAAQRRLAA